MSSSIQPAPRRAPGAAHHPGPRRHARGSIGRTLRPRALPAAAVFASLAFGLAACGSGGGSVHVTPPPDVSGADVSSCRRLQSQLPESLDAGVRRQPTSPASPLTAAWGRPTVTLRCGVGVPAGYEPTSELTDIDGVGWFASRRASSVVWTATEARPRVEVVIPDKAERPDVLIGNVTDAVLSAGLSRPAGQG